MIWLRTIFQKPVCALSRLQAVLAQEGVQDPRHGRHHLQVIRLGLNDIIRDADPDNIYRIRPSDKTWIRFNI